jgi:hypothetical protein
MAGSSFSLSGNGSLNTDGTAAPKDFTLIGLPGNQDISLSGNAAYVGTIYAPNSNLTLSGGGNPANNTDFSGAAVVKSATMNGHFTFHYDTALPNLGIIRGFDAKIWEEL